MSEAETVDPCRCPLCGGPNACAMTQPQVDRAQEPCWCTHEQFSPNLLQKVPEPLRRKACICRTCVRASQVES